MGLLVLIERVDETDELAARRVGSEILQDGGGIVLRVAGRGRIIPGCDFGVVFAGLDDDVGDFLGRDFEHGRSPWRWFALLHRSKSAELTQCVLIRLKPAPRGGAPSVT